MKGTVRLRTLLILSAAIPLSALATPDASRLRLYPYLYEAVVNVTYIPAEWGTLQVPENRSRPDSRLIEFPFFRFKSTSPNPAAPIFLLPGGPGSTWFTIATSARGAGYIAWLRSIADVVILEQRGVNRSHPLLDSPYTYDLPLDRPLAREALRDQTIALAKKTRAFWEAQGIDLSAYNVNQMADDVNELREALGYQKISLLGISFGSHWGLAVIARHEQHLSRAILSGIHGRDMTYDMPLEMDAQVARVAALVKADPTWGPLLPDMVGTIRNLLEQLAREPVTVMVDDPLNHGKKIPVVVGKIDLQQAVTGSLFRGMVANIEKGPAEIYAMTQGDFSKLAESAVTSRRARARNAMNRVVRNQSGGSAERLAAFHAQAKQSLYEDYHEYPSTEDSAAWGGYDLGAEFRRNLVSDFPLLIMNGDLDAYTPMTNAIETIAGFRNGHLIKLRNYGHASLHSEAERYSLFMEAPELRDILADYLRGKPVTTPTWVDLPPLRFAPPKGRSAK